MNNRWLFLPALICSAFALRTLFLIDATSLWSDELYSVGKSFQPSLGALVEMLREDNHPPFYYFLLWIWGQLIGQTPVTLRLLSWCAYCLGGVVMVRQSLAIGGRNLQVLTVAGLLAFCSPYPVRFAIEGKSYALLLLLVAAVRTSLAICAGFCLGRNHPFLWSVFGACSRCLGWPEGQDPVCCGRSDGGIAWLGLDCLCL